MSRRQPPEQQDATSSRPIVSRTVSLALVAVALVVFLAIQSGGLSGIMDGQQVSATQTVADSDTNDNSTDSPEAPRSDQAAAADTTLTPENTGEETATAAEAPRATLAPTPTANAPPVERASDLPIVAYGELPPEAHATIALIDSDGPFPFDKDGSTFQNREGILPDRAMGYYREYTVITPDEDDRGARRIVGGEDGELYYTDDHYNSFREIIR